MTKIIVTPEEVKENMKDYIAKTEIEFGKPVTYVSVRMKNGFTIRESTTCVDPKNYNEDMGIKICLEKIEDKVWAFLGYALQDKQSKEKPTDITERVKTFEDACEVLGYEHPYVKTWNSIYQGTEEDVDLIDHIAYMKLRIICMALNEDPDFPRFKESEYRYFPYFYLRNQKEINSLDDTEKEMLCLWGGGARNGSDCGLVFSPSTYAFSNSSSLCGARLALKSKRLAEYCGKQFINIWKDFLIAKK